MLNIDTTKTVEQNMLALVNLVCGTSFVHGDLSFAPPVDTDLNSTVGMTPNTSVVISSANTSKYTGGPVNFPYERVDLEKAAATRTLQVTGDYTTETDATLLAKIATMLGVIASELVNREALVKPVNGQLVTLYSVQANPASLLYVGTASVQVNWINTPAVSSWEVPGNLSDGVFFASGKLWTSNGNAIVSMDATTGATLTSLNLNTQLGITDANYFPQLLDNNGILWAMSNSGFVTDRPQLIRIDTSTGLYKDGLFHGTGPGPGGVEFQMFAYDKGNNTLWAVQVPYPGQGSPALVQIDVTTGAIAKTLSTNLGPFGGGGLIADPVNHRLWLSAYISNIYVIQAISQVDGSVIATISNTGGYSFNNGSAMVYVPSTQEFVLLDFNQTTQLYRWSRWSATIMSKLASVDLTTPDLDQSTQWSVNLGAIAYRADTDEVLTYVYTQPNSTSWGILNEIRAYKRTDFTFTRVVIPSVGNRGVETWAQGPDNKVYINFTGGETRNSGTWTIAKMIAN